MDPLSAVLALLNPRTYNVGGLNIGMTSAIQFPQHNGIKCYAVVSGEAWLAVHGIPDAVHLKAGHCILLPSGKPFRLAATREQTLGPGRDFSFAHCGSISSFDGGGNCLIVGAHYAFTDVQAALLLGVLPPVVHLQNQSENVALLWTLQRMTKEIQAPMVGGVLVAHYLAKMMLVQALRVHVQEDSRHHTGWLSALSDKQMNAAITTMHDEPAHDWTVDELAQSVGMSRSAFSLKFKSTVGQSPIEYLTRWRMLLAEDRMQNTSSSIAEIAQSLGYESPSAFAKVFRKFTGSTPREHRRRHDEVSNFSVMK